MRLLAPFFRTLQETMLEHAPCSSGTPHIVLLTPGPYNETYFEHAYLSRYLGFTLAEGADLTVRDDRVFLKTVSGLRPVHGILRRLDDDLLRSAGAARRFDARRAGPGAGVARRPRAAGQRLRHGRARVAGAQRVSAERRHCICLASR